MPQKFTKAGFSLIEICVVLIILSILTCLIYPNYQRIITKTHRLDGKLALIHLALQMDQYFTLNNTYENAARNNYLSPQGYYTLIISDASSTRFTAKAIPTSKHLDKKCNIFTINQKGEKSIEPATSQNVISICWEN